MGTLLHLVCHDGLSKVVGAPPQDTCPPSTVSVSPTPGIVCDFRLSYGRVLSRRSKIIIVNRNRKEMLINSDMFWKPQEAVQGEPPVPPPAPCVLILGLLLPLQQLKEAVLPDSAPEGSLLARDKYFALRLVGASE